MEKEKIQQIKEQLLQKKESLETELSKVAQKKGKDFVPIYPDYGSKDEENAAEIAEYEIHLALDRNLEKLLSETLRALAKIEAGTYGSCDFCEAEIPEGRLEASPSASLCITCQAKKDNPVTKFFNKLKPHKNIKQPSKLKIKNPFSKKKESKDKS